jgi:hypothetical protein
LGVIYHGDEVKEKCDFGGSPGTEVILLFPEEFAGEDWRRCV